MQSKGLVLAIMILFVGTGFTPALVSGDTGSIDVDALGISDITSTSVQLNAICYSTIPTNAWFYYGLTDNINDAILTGGQQVHYGETFSQTITGLTPETTYHWWVYGEQSGGVVGFFDLDYGGTFTTLEDGGTTIYVPDDYSTIQGAVNVAISGDTIIVRDDVYSEYVYVHKSVTIKSENGAGTTIVRTPDPQECVFWVLASGVTISGFTIEGATGLCHGDSRYRSVGLYAVGDSASNIHFSNNIVRDNYFGIGVGYSASNNVITNNILQNNCVGIVAYSSANSNLIYLNNFINNEQNVHSSVSTNIWNSPEKIIYTYSGNTYINYLGNYWDDYTSFDNDGDRIGDTPYSIEGDNNDYYPLMEPFENYFDGGGNQHPEADIGVEDDISVFSGELVAFSGLNSNDPDGDTLTYLWDFGNGESSSECNVNYRFRGSINEPKTYIVTLTVNDGRGGTDTDTVNVIVAPLEKEAVLGMAGMKVTYNWVKQINGKDVYIITKIQAWTIGGWAGITQFSILSGETALWRDVWLFQHFRSKDYYSPFIPTNDWIDLQFGAQFGVIPTITIMFFPEGNFEGIQVYAADKFEVKTRGLVAGIGIIPSPNVDTAWTTFDPDTPVESFNIFTPLENTWNWITGKLFSPCEFRIYDLEGRITGLIDGEVKEEIPYSVYYQHFSMVLFPSEWLLYEILGTDRGFYGLRLASPFNEDILIFNASTIPTSSNVIHQYTINWTALSQGEEGVTLQIDADGNGIFEQTVTADSELTHDEFMLQTETVIDINPDTLNLNSSGKWITCYTELPEGYDVADINISTILLNDVVPSDDHPTNIGDYDNDGIPDLMVKFDRQAVQDILELGSNVEITVAGELIDGIKFVGIDYIRVI